MRSVGVVVHDVLGEQSKELALAEDEETLVYLVANSASTLIPSPGGLGALDVSLALVLARAGADTSMVIAAVAGYRLMTAWLPLVPAMLTLGILARRRVI